MDIERFEASTRESTPRPDLHPLLAALWYDARGDWGRAHTIVQGEQGPDAAAVHAYLHRKEGDLANADYWYGRAHKTRPEATLAVEWRGLAQRLLEIAAE